MVVTANVVRDRTIYDLRAQGNTLQEISDKYHVSRERIRQIMVRAEKIYGPLPARRASELKSLAWKEVREQEKQRRTEEAARRKLKRQRDRSVESFQLDADLVGKFLYELEYRVVEPKVQNTYNGYPSDEAVRSLRFRDRSGRVWLLHTWVLEQHGITTSRKVHGHHIDGDVTNNMFENLVPISNKVHGLITQIERLGSVAERYEDCLDVLLYGGIEFAPADCSSI